MKKICTRCRQEKDEADFGWNVVNGKSYVQSQCISCRGRKCYRQNPDKNLEAKLKYKYGIDLIDYEIMFDEQGGVCAICKKPQTRGTRLFVDHNHHTGKVRALLCYKCNTMIGLANDNSEQLRAAVAYLEAHP